MSRRFWLLAAFACALGAALFAWTSGRVRAQVATPSDDDVNAIARQLYCPVCENTPLDVCPTEACRQWRDLIREMLAEGKGADEIMQYFVDTYGARVLAEPPRSGLNWLAYVVPPAAFLLGVALLSRAFFLWRRQPAAAAPTRNPRGGKPADDAYVSRLEEELRKRERGS